MRRQDEALRDLFKPTPEQWTNPHYKGKWYGQQFAYGSPAHALTAEKEAEKAALPKPPRERAGALPKMTQPGVQVVDKETEKQVVQVPGSPMKIAAYLARNKLRPTKSPTKYESDDYWFLLHGFNAGDMKQIVASLRGETAGQSLRRRYAPGAVPAEYGRPDVYAYARGKDVPDPAHLRYAERTKPKTSLKSWFRFQSPLSWRSDEWLPRLTSKKYPMLITSRKGKPQQVMLNAREAVQYLSRIGAQPSTSGASQYKAGGKTYSLDQFPPKLWQKVLKSMVGESLEQLPPPPLE